ncbi:hypothetical protein QTP88_024716 [Uroleucon formosanum]
MNDSKNSNNSTSIFQDNIINFDEHLLSSAITSELETPPPKKKNANPLFISICKSINLINVLLKWFVDINKLYGTAENVVCFHKFTLFRESLLRSIKKHLVLSKVNGKTITTDAIGLSPYYKIKNVEDLEKTLILFENTKLCQGSISTTKCINIKSTLGVEEKCLWCKRLNYIINKRLSKQNSRIYFFPNKKKKGSRLAEKIRHLQENLNNLKNKMAAISESTLEKIIKDFNIPSSAKLKNSKNRRYSENWMLLCLLFQIRSPTRYIFLKDQNILPLLCVSTISKNLLAIKINCGFDPNLFKLLKKKFSTKSENQKKGIILLDEMFLRESLSINSRSLTYIGLEDFGNEELVRKNSNLKANHGLVFMWQSLAENMVQPIAVFASAGPVKVINNQNTQIKNSGKRNINVKEGDLVLVKDYQNKNENWQKRKITENIGQNTHKIILDEGSEWIRHTDQIWPHNQINNSLSPATSMIDLPDNDSTKSEPTYNIASIDTQTTPRPSRIRKPPQRYSPSN